MTGEEKIFVEDLYAQYFDILMRYAFVETGSLLVAEDLVHDTFYEAMNERSTQKMIECNNPIGWLMNTLKNKLKNYNKRRWRIENIEDEEEPLQDMEIDNRYGLMELNMVMDKVCNPHEKMLFHMYFIEKHSSREMAELEGISENNFKVRMSRLRKRVADELKDI